MLEWTVTTYRGITDATTSCYGHICRTFGLASQSDLPARAAGAVVITSVILGRLFLSSYAPLFAILAVRTAPHIGDHAPGWVFLTAVGLTVIGIADGSWLLASARHRSGRTLTPVEVDEQGAAVAGYLPTYLLPFIGLGDESIGGWIGYGIYLGVLFVVFLGSDFALVNPTLYLLGRRVTRVTAELQHVNANTLPTRSTFLVVSTDQPVVGRPIYLAQLAGCWVQKPGGTP